MNQFKQLLLLFVSISGLISCSPDKSENTSTAPDTSVSPLGKGGSFKNVQIEKSDGSFRVVSGETDNINISGRIQLIYKEDTNPVGTLNSSVSCHSPQRQQKLTKDIKMEFDSSTEYLPISDLIPPLALAPMPQGEDIVCSFIISFYEQEQHTVDIKLDNKSITGINDLANWDVLPGASPDALDSRKLFQLSELESYKLQFPNMSIVQTICEDSEIEIFVSEEEKPLTSFIDKSLFAEKAMNRCRFVSTEEKGSSVRISKIINILGRRPDLKISSGPRIASHSTLIHPQENTYLITVKNFGDASGAINFSTPKNSQINIIPFYGNPLPAGKIGIFPKMVVEGNWYELSTDRKLAADALFEIAPGESLSFGFVPHQKVVCSLAETNYRGACSRSNYLGSSIELTVPLIYERGWRSSEERFWSHIKSPMDSRVSGQIYKIFAPNKDLSSYCPSYPVVNSQPAHQGTPWFGGVPGCMMTQ